MTTTAPTPIDIGAGIRHARKAAGLTQADLANRLEVTRAAVAMWEGGYRPVKTHTLLQIVEITGLDLNTLLDKARDATK